ncbi:MAG TPA: hypothetical protein VFS00_12370, partial [Polyangiaceae bacterium]|nr:hypothetical protein [Polyangiaceae bacterium]
MLSLCFAAALPLVGVACGDDDDGENGGNTTAGLSAACAQYFDAIQALSDRCFYGTPLDDDFRPSSREGFVRECSRSAVFPGMPPGLAPTVSKCASSLAAIDCNAVYGDDDLLCPEFADLRGSLAAGEPCEESLQCESGSCSRFNGACGTCARTVQEGESCVEDGVTCAEGLLCDRSADGKTGTCGRRKQ